MTPSLRHLFMSTSLGVAAVALAPMGAAQAQDLTTCMEDVQRLRAQETLGKGGQSIDAWANAAEVACAAGDYGMASAYIADAERRMNLKEAQRDDIGARGEQAALDRGGTGAVGFGDTGFGGAALNPDDDSVVDDVGDIVDDVGDDIEEFADDIGDEFDDFTDDFNDPDAPTPEVRTMDAIRGPEPRTEVRGVETVSPVN